VGMTFVLTHTSMNSYCYWGHLKFNTDLVLVSKTSLDI